MRLLLAEPTPTISDIISRISKLEKIQFDTARDVETLFSYLKEENFDVIYLAPNIDTEDGLNVLKKIRSLPDFRYIPIFLIASTYYTADFVHNALAAGATDIIDKQDFESLHFYIQRFIKNQQPLGANVMVVEDSSTQQILLTSLLSDLGCQVDCFQTAEEAYTNFNNKEYDLIVTDIVLESALSGLALAGRIRRIEGISGDVPILAITGYDEPSREQSLYAYGVSDYIIKPINSIKFCHIIKNLVNFYQSYKALAK